MADFLRIEPELLAVAAAASERGTTAVEPCPKALAQWIGSLSEAEKDKLLLRLLGDDAPAARQHALQRLRRATAKRQGPTAGQSRSTPRTAAELLAACQRRA